MRKVTLAKVKIDNNRPGISWLTVAGIARSILVGRNILGTGFTESTIQL